MSYTSRIACVLLIFYGAAAVLAHTWRPPAVQRYAGIDPSMIPRSIAPYDVSQDYDMGPNVKRLLSTGDIVSRRYALDGAPMIGPETVDFVLIGGQDRNSMHDPRLCLTGAGDRLSNDHVLRLPGSNVDARAYSATSKDGVTYNMVYFYVTNGRIDNEYAHVRRSMLWCDLTGQVKPPIYFLRFTQLTSPDPASVSAGFDNLAGFAGSMWSKLKPQLDKHA